MTWRNRVLCDGRNREEWLKHREPRIGASDVKQYAKIESVEKYVLAKIRARSFFGNEFTASGNEHESMILAYLGVEPNTALIHSPENQMFAATPDGIGNTLAEVKTRHGRIKPAPDAGEWRQLAWQLLCVPEFDTVKFGTLTVLRNPRTGAWEPRSKDAFTELIVHRDHPKILAATAQIVPIAEQVLAALDVALEAQKETT